MRKNISNWKVLNNTLPLFAMFCLVSILYIGCRINYWYFLLIVFMPFLFYKKKINAYQILILLSIFLVFSILIIFAWEYGLVSLYKRYAVGYVRKAIFNFLDRSYSEEISSFIKLIMFNVKSKSSYIFYKQTVDLGIVWLFCISGFHISLFSKIISLCFKKIPKIGRYVNISIILFYSYLLNFSYASLRIIIKLCLEPVFKQFKTKRFDKIGIIGMLIALVNPNCFKDYGFLLSFLICIGVNSVQLLNLNSKIINKILINILAFGITIPFVIKMNNKISLFTFINSFIFNFISPIIYFYFLIFMWMPFMQIVHHGIMVGTYAIIGNISFANIFIYSKPWEPYIICIYYLFMFTLAKIIYLIVYNNKI